MSRARVALVVAALGGCFEHSDDKPADIDAPTDAPIRVDAPIMPEMPPTGLQCDPMAPAGLQGCAPGQGCYALASETTSIAVCASAGVIQVGELIPDKAFANSCVPGASPRPRFPGSAEMECGGLCRPAAVTPVGNQALEGGIAPDDCQTRWHAPAPGAAGGESCRHWWTRQGSPVQTVGGNRIGWCFQHDTFDAPRCTEATLPDSGCLPL